MGGKGSASPYYSPYYRQVETFSRNAGMDISPFTSQIQQWGERQASKAQEFVQGIQNRALEGLRFAISNAVGQVTTTPYERIYSEKAGQMLQKRVEPIEGVVSDITSQYQQIAPQLGGALKLAGAYVSIPTPQEIGDSRVEGQYRELLPSYQNAYNASLNFMRQTVDMLKKLEFTDDEIKQTIQPFVQQFQIGASDVGSRFGFMKMSPESATEKWLKEIGL